MTCVFWREGGAAGLDPEAVTQSLRGLRDPEPPRPASRSPSALPTGHVNGLAGLQQAGAWSNCGEAERAQTHCPLGMTGLGCEWQCV